MKIHVLARPDHSLYLYDHLRTTEDIRLSTFNVVKKHSVLHKLFPSAKIVGDEVHILYDFTLTHRILFKLAKRKLINPYRFESRFSEIAFARELKHSNADILHYWPIYCHKAIRKERNKKRVVTVADVYAAHPAHVVHAIEKEYAKFNLPVSKSYFHIDGARNLEFLEHEQNIITNSQYVKDTFLERHPSLNIHVADYGVFGNMQILDHYKKAIENKHQKSGLRLLYAGSISLEKGMHYLLEVMHKLKSKTVSLDVIGSPPPEQNHLFQQVPGNVRFLGPMPNSLVKKNIRNYDVLILPSLSDANSIAVIEAQQQGLPVIISENTGNKSLVTKFNTGIVVKTADADSLQAAIEQMTDPGFREHLSSNIENLILNDIAEGYPKQILSIYKMLIEDGRK